jgi:hypothetical protein
LILLEYKISPDGSQAYRLTHDEAADILGRPDVSEEDRASLEAELRKGEAHRANLDEATDLFSNPETPAVERAALETAIDAEFNFQQANGAIDDEIPAASLSTPEKIKILRNVDKADDKKPLFGHIKNRSERKKLRRQFNRLVTREARVLRRAVLRTSRGTNRESHGTVGAKSGAGIATAKGGRTSGGGSEDDGGSGSSGDSDDPPGPGVRAPYHSSVKSHSKKSKPEYFNRRLPRCCWRVAERRRVA